MHTEEPLRYAVDEFVRKLRAEELDIEGWTLQRLWEEELGQDGHVNIFDLSTELDHKGLALIVADLTNPAEAKARCAERRSRLHDEARTPWPSLSPAIPTVWEGVEEPLSVPVPTGGGQ